MIYLKIPKIYFESHVLLKKKKEMVNLRITMYISYYYIIIIIILTEAPAKAIDDASQRFSTSSV
jgi:hypothetical protein